MYQQATLGGGCFWCLEAVYQRVRGVVSVVPGYAGGHVPNPTYEHVCTGTTGHAEVVQITFDPRLITYRDLLTIFWHIHDPTTPNRQGNDVGPQYRSIILYHDEEQRREAEASKAEAEASGLWPAPFVTEIVPLTAFYEAEPYHHDYFRRHPDHPYCRLIIAPKVAKFLKTFPEKASTSGASPAGR
ncbi:MAG: peptide-methionine (S)-S-oxide reductase MsrA [Ardenticatenia bacterium]|nr:peptide-methionine (S)-S-oxide reductase MsrA [Ardenticatenia bacterium]